MAQITGRRRRGARVVDCDRIRISPHARVGDLPQVERQIVEIAKALIQQPRILIMDEPSSLLTVREEPLIFAALRRFTARGGAVLYVTHRLHETILIGSRVSLMRQGRIVETRSLDARSSRTGSGRGAGGRTSNSRRRRGDRKFHQSHQSDQSHRGASVLDGPRSECRSRLPWRQPRGERGRNCRVSTDYPAAAVRPWCDRFSAWQRYVAVLSSMALAVRATRGRRRYPASCIFRPAERSAEFSPAARFART